jgi:pimeloyl-ACP methyl ester carboxylesterase
MTKPVITATTLVTEDGVPIDAVHLPGPKDLAIVVAHGFTLSWQRPRVWRIANRFNLGAGVVTFDFRGHGRSGGLSTLGDLEIKDLDVAVAYARELGYQRIAAVGFSMGSSVVLRHAGLIGGLDAVVSISGPGRWYYRGTQRMRRVQPGGLETGPGPAGRSGREDRPRPAADRPRRPGSVLPARACPPALPGRRRAQGVVADTRDGPRRDRLRQRPHRPHRPLARPSRPRRRHRPRRRRRPDRPRRGRFPGAPAEVAFPARQSRPLPSLAM